MVRTVILDLDERYIEEKEEFLFRLKRAYQIETGTAVLPEKTDVVVLTDKGVLEERWKNDAVIGIEHGNKINYTAYVLEDLEDLTGFDIELAYARKFCIPCMIAANDKFTLREISPEDIAELKTIYEEKETVRYIPAMDSTEAETDNVLSYIRYMYGYYGYGLWVMEDNGTGRIIGRAGIEHREIDGQTFCELAYLVRKEYRGKGYGYQAAEMALEFAKKYGMKELITYIDAKNIPSVHLSEKLGFIRWKEVTDGTENYIVYRKEL